MQPLGFDNLCPFFRAKELSMKNWLKKFHRDEQGLEALQVVLIVAIAAIILALLKTFWPQIKQWFSDNVTEVLGFGK
jgi:Flp pilus assembly pilin Flp